MIKKALLKQALTVSERRVIWDSLNTYHHVESSNGVLLKSEDKDIKKLIPLFQSTLPKPRKRKCK